MLCHRHYARNGSDGLDLERSHHHFESRFFDCLYVSSGFDIYYTAPLTVDNKQCVIQFSLPPLGLTRLG